MDSAGGVVAAPQAAAGPAGAAQPLHPFNPPTAVQQWLRREDWEALSRAWEEAEAQAINWADDEDDEAAAAAAEDSLAGGASYGSYGPGAPYGNGVDLRPPRSQAGSSVNSSLGPVAPKRRRMPWKEDFSLIGSDSRKPPPLRRYFDPVPAETSPPRQPIRRGLQQAASSQSSPNVSMFSPNTSLSAGPSIKEKPAWLDTWYQKPSTDNDGIHPHLRHYFDQRGMEATFRQRPQLDHPSAKNIKPRSPGRPPTAEKILKWRSSSEPTLQAAKPAPAKPAKPAKKASPKEPARGPPPDPGPPVDIDAKARGHGNIHWGTRCLRYGADVKGPKGQRIPWVYDHHVSEAEDNEIMHPMLRHYFDADGIESSFRNRGRQYGRPPKTVMGLQQSPMTSVNASFSSMSTH